MLLCHVMSSVHEMASNLVAMGSPAFAQVVATESDVCCTEFLGRLQTVCPVAGCAVAEPTVSASSLLAAGDSRQVWFL